jgi:hypothetical protein
MTQNNKGWYTIIHIHSQVVRVGIGISSSVSNRQAVWTMAQALTDSTIPHFMIIWAPTLISTIQQTMDRQ